MPCFHAVHWRFSQLPINLYTSIYIYKYIYTHHIHTDVCTTIHGRNVYYGCYLNPLLVYSQCISFWSWPTFKDRCVVHFASLFYVLWIDRWLTLNRFLCCFNCLWPCLIWKKCSVVEMKLVFAAVDSWSSQISILKSVSLKSRTKLHDWLSRTDGQRERIPKFRSSTKKISFTKNSSCFGYDQI